MELILVRIGVGGLLFFMLAFPKVVFNPDRMWPGLIVTILLGCFLPFLFMDFLFKMAAMSNWPKDIYPNLFIYAFSTSVIPFVLLKFCWDHLNKREELQLKRKELELSSNDRK